MSIHRSKGLEFPVVILCDLNHRFNGADQTSPVLVHPRLGLGTERVDTARRVRYPTISKIALAQEMEKEMLSEEMRLLYVAMTRAKEKLILVDCLKNARSHVQKLSALTELPVPPQVVRSAKTMGDWVLQVLLCSTEAGAIHAWAGIAPPVRETLLRLQPLGCRKGRVPGNRPFIPSCCRENIPIWRLPVSPLRLQLPSSRVGSWISRSPRELHSICRYRRNLPRQNLCRSSRASPRQSEVPPCTW